MRICILTFEFNYNYGAVLQAFSLKKVLETYGHEVCIMNRGWDEYIGAEKNILSGRIFLDILLGRFYTLKAFHDFKRKYFNLTDPVCNYQDLCNKSDKFDAVIVGSDQIWNDEIFPIMGLYYFAESFHHVSKKIAYAVSFGKDTFVVPERFKSKLLTELQSFNALSVREVSGIKILSDLGFKSSLVLDPTLLLAPSDFPVGKRKHNYKYVCRFLLDETPIKRDFIRKFSNHLNLKEVNNYLNLDFSFPIIRKVVNNKYIPVSEWLSNIKNAEFVLTDSFHGMVFSILFHKQFLVFQNKKRGNARFESLLGRLGLLDHLISGDEDINIQYNVIDYKKVDEELKSLRDISLSFLIDALK